MSEVSDLYSRDMFQNEAGAREEKTRRGSLKVGRQEHIWRNNFWNTSSTPLDEWSQVLLPCVEVAATKLLDENTEG